ncbi:hypothetical protein [Novosphingobium sp.]|uniref:hypothetical protein n=1 Tax=Novosphingobium sp. TaxID=1874826 RepID=UPI002FD9AD94
MDHKHAMGSGGLPEYRAELFSPDALRDPFAHYRHIRDLGPAVYLPQYDIIALGASQTFRTLSEGRMS